MGAIMGPLWGSNDIISLKYLMPHVQWLIAWSTDMVEACVLCQSHH